MGCRSQATSVLFNHKDVTDIILMQMHIFFVQVLENSKS